MIDPYAARGVINKVGSLEKDRPVETCSCGQRLDWIILLFW